LKVAAVADAQGAVLGLASRGPRFATRTTSGRHDWLWMEYVAQDPDRALDFYTDLAGYRYEVSDRLEHFVYFVFSSDRPHAGLLRSLWEGEPSAWVPYIRVDDPAAMAARVTQLGGTVVIAPNARVRNGSLALVLDPSGAVIALQKYPFDRGTTK
jgi:predicted enzyme related to lactoylglutathione lyase